MEQFSNSCPVPFQYHHERLGSGEPPRPLANLGDFFLPKMVYPQVVLGRYFLAVEPLLVMYTQVMACILASMKFLGSICCIFATSPHFLAFSYATQVILSGLFLLLFSLPFGATWLT